MASRSSGPSGCWARLPQLLIIIIVATLLASGLFVALPLLRGRPDLPRGTSLILVEGNIVRVAADPAQEVFLVPLGGVGGATGEQTVVQVATGTPAVLPTAAATATTQPLPTAPPPTITPIPQASCIAFTNYTVASGDTLFSISRKFVTSIPLMARHGISSTSLIPAAVIRVPVGDPACCSGGWRPYVVEDGDTWFGIAAQCGITTDALLQGNGLASGAPLFMASVICIP
ncbi:MAG: LysM peptidoglycan-binding domain-containing protein [Chloroflexota bacterium]